MNGQGTSVRFKFAQELAANTRTVTLPAFKLAQDPDNKTEGLDYFDPVTQTDKNAELFLREHISKAFPDDAILGEEFPKKTGTSGWSWCLDPVDGTRAFVAGVPVWSTLIGVSFQQKPTLGVIDFPALDQCYIGNCQSAWRLDKTGLCKITTKACTGLNSAVLSCTEPLAMFSDPQFETYQNIRKQVRFSRLGLDALGYALIAEGRLDIVIEAGLQPYDVQALIPVILGAGGAFTNWNGDQGDQGGAIICVGDPSLLDELYKIINL